MYVYRRQVVNRNVKPKWAIFGFCQSCSHWAKYLSLSPVVVTLICLSAVSLCPSRALHVLHSNLYLYARNKDWQNGTVQLRGTDGAWVFMGLSHVSHDAVQHVKKVWRTDLRRSSASLFYVQPAATGRTLQYIVMEETEPWADGLATRCSRSVAILRTGCWKYVYFWTDRETDWTALVQTVRARGVLARLYKITN